MRHVLFCNMSSVCQHMVTVMFSMIFLKLPAVFIPAEMHESLSFWIHFDAFVPFSSQMQLYPIYSCRDNCHAALKMLTKKRLLHLSSHWNTCHHHHVLLKPSSFSVRAQRNLASLNSFTEPAWEMKHVCSFRGLVTWHPTAPWSPTPCDRCEMFSSLWIEIWLCVI